MNVSRDAVRGNPLVVNAAVFATEGEHAGPHKDGNQNEGRYPVRPVDPKQRMAKEPNSTMAA